MNLEADFSVGRDVQISLGVIECGHAINPAADATAFRQDAVFVPFAFLDGSEHGFGVHRISDDFIAAAFVVNLAIPAGAKVDLITAHLRVIRNA